MLINDPKKFAIVCSTKNRPAFVRRMIASLEAQAFKGLLLIVDASDSIIVYTSKNFEIRCCEHLAPVRGNNWLETAEGMVLLESECVLWHHDDDIYFLPAVERAATRLIASPNAVCSQGRELFMHAFKRADGSIYLGMGSPGRFDYTEPEPLDRLKSAFTKYCHLFFAVTRREPFIETCRRVAGYFPTAGIFDQYAWSLSLLRHGTALLHDDLYALRQKHLSNHSRLIEPLNNWPLLLANPNFSDYVMAFGECLDDAYEPTDLSVFDAIVYHGIVSLVRRALGADHMDAQLEFKLAAEFQQGDAARKIKALMRATTIGGQ